jgi:hypothetical protein
MPFGLFPQTASRSVYLPANRRIFSFLNHPPSSLAPVLGIYRCRGVLAADRYNNINGASQKYIEDNGINILQRGKGA